MNTFKLIISSPDGDAFNDQAEALFVRGVEGELAVMAGHIPFMTSVSPCVCRVALADGSEKSAQVDGGILTVSADSTVLLSSSFNWI